MAEVCSGSPALSHSSTWRRIGDPRFSDSKFKKSLIHRLFLDNAKTCAMIHHEHGTFNTRF
jgi:hypothetical protein